MRFWQNCNISNGCICFNFRCISSDLILHESQLSIGVITFIKIDYCSVFLWYMDLNRVRYLRFLGFFEILTKLNILNGCIGVNFCRISSDLIQHESQLPLAFITVIKIDYRVVILKILGFNWSTIFTIFRIFGDFEKNCKNDKWLCLLKFPSY